MHSNSQNTKVSLNSIGIMSDSPVKELHSPLDRFGKTVHTVIQEGFNDANYAIRSMLISGDWGAGKTSVLKFIESQYSNEKKTKVIFFEAWRYEKEASLVSALLWQMIMQSDKYPSLQKRLNSKIVKIIDYITTFIIKVCTRTTAADAINNREHLQMQRIKEATSSKIEKIGDTDKFLGAYSDLLKNFYRETKKLLIIIDDLDRCSPNSSIDLLDSVRHLINFAEVKAEVEKAEVEKEEAEKAEAEKEEDKDSKLQQQKCLFLVAMDKTTLQHSIRHKFADLSSYDSNRYLEKLFPISMQLPTLNIAFTDLLHNNGSAAELENVEGINEIFNQDFFCNVRLMKRCLNQLFIYKFSNPTDKQTANEHDETSTSIELGLFEWIAAINRWPDLRIYINTKNSAFWDRVAERLYNKMNVQAEHIEDDTINILLAQPNVKEFLRSSYVFGSIYNETSLAERVVTYKEYEKQLKQVGL